MWYNSQNHPKVLYNKSIAPKRDKDEEESVRYSKD